MDNLEEYVRRHREELDLHKAPSGIWKRIENELGTGRLNRYRWIAAAAMITVVLGTAAVLYNRGIIPGNNHSKAFNEKMINRINAQLRETEIYYNNLATSLYDQASPLLVKNPELEKELDADMTHIDSICLEIKKDLRDNVANQDVIEALIQNYRTRITILEEMLGVLKETENNTENTDGNEI